MYLWHGTRTTEPSKIYRGEEGFDVIFSSEGMWGQGLYFAKNASYSHLYAHKHANGDRGMFLALVNIGSIADVEYDEKITRSFRSPPDGKDSVRGKAEYRANKEMTSSEIFVVYANKKAYPMYYVTYKD